MARAVDGVSFELDRGETLGLVGESGCGKSVSALSIMRLIPNPPGEIVGGEILYNGTDLLKIPEDKMRSIRGNDISMIFQEPMTSLNPVFTVGHQMRRCRSAVSKASAKPLDERLRMVGIPAPISVQGLSP